MLQPLEVIGRLADQGTWGELAILGIMMFGIAISAGLTGWYYIRQGLGGHNTIRKGDKQS